MSRQILVIGGNRFFGKRLVERLLKNGDKVTVLNRGQLDDGFGDSIDRIICNRDDVEKFAASVKHKTWDVVYDQVCFDANQAKSALHIFEKLTKKFIFASTVSVYPLKANLFEEDFDPYTYEYDKILTREENYGEAKRQCEAVFFAQNKLPVTAVRFPIVMGPDDYTERLKFYVDKIKNEDPIYFPNINAQMSFIHSVDAAEGLFLLGNIDFTGPINLASEKPLRLSDLVKTIEKVVSKKAIIHSNQISKQKSPYGIESDWSINVQKSIDLGFKPADISNWIAAVISQHK